ncbi:MAG TPA: polysaccharide biosynthesis tyrosine autokinase [Gemmatimonadaceae bacterium]|nr:polysaccharide biosynthesis tyrosine autokinase [Gemmatimonadaceae bacterium]
MSDFLDDGPVTGSSTGDRNLALRNAFIAIQRRWWLVLGVFVIVVTFAVWNTSRQQRQYRTTAVVQVGEARQPMTSMTQAPQWDYRIDPMQSAQEIIRSSRIAERAAERAGLRLTIASPPLLQRSVLFGDSVPRVDSAVTYGEYTVMLSETGYALRQNARVLDSARYGDPVDAGGVHFVIPRRPALDETEVVLRAQSRTDAGRMVRGAVITRGRPQTNIIEISYTGTDPYTVMLVTNAVADAYREYASENRMQEAAGRAAIIERSLQDQRRRLDSAQREVELFKRGNRLSNVSAEQAELIGAIARFEAERDAALIERGVYEQLMGRVSAADTSTEELRRLAGSEAVRSNPYVNQLYEQWFELRKKHEELRAAGKVSPHPEARAVDSLIAGTKANLQHASGLYLQGLQSRLQSLGARIASLRGEMTRYPGLEAQEQKLAADLRMIQTVYDELQSEYQRARIAEQVRDEFVEIVDEAPRPGAPIAPNRKRIYLTAMIFGALLGLASAVAVEQLDDSVKSPDEARERFDLTVLGTIPQIKEAGAARRLADGASHRLVTHLDPRSPVAEAYRSLRTNLAFARAHEALKTIVLTSPGPADGKSTTVANLAITFAQQGQRTLLIDADLRRAVLDKLFGAPREPGLTDVLVGRVPLAQVLSETAITNLHVLGSGPFPPNPSELLGSQAMRDVLRDAQAEFDIVLLDSPPLLAVTDAAVLSTMVDGAILVVRMGSTPRTSVRRAISQLQTVHGRLVGTVLNDVDFRAGLYGGGYGYYYYYYYGTDGQRNGSRGGILGRVQRWTRRGTGMRRERT